MIIRKNYKGVDVVFGIVTVFILGWLFRVVGPAISELPDKRLREKTKQEVKALLSCLSDYKNHDLEKRFPATLSKLDGNRLKKHGVIDSSSLGSKYWYLPNVTTRVDNIESPILIEKPNHYSHYKGGFVAYADGEMAMFFVGVTYTQIVQLNVARSQ